MNEQERLIRALLEARDPGAAPPRLRAAAAQVPGAIGGSLVAALGASRWRGFGPSPVARMVLVALIVLGLVLAIAGALLMRPWDPFPPRGLIAYTTALDATGSSGVRLIAADGSGGRTLSAGAANVYDHSPRWSADGRTLLIARTSQLDPLGACAGVGSIVLHDLETGREREIASGLRPIAIVEWSPTEDRIAFVWPPLGCNAPPELGVLDTATGVITTSPLADGSVHEGPMQLQWSPSSVVPAPLVGDVASGDGRFAASSSTGRDDSQRLEVRDLQTGARVDLGIGLAASWSPDGRSLAFIQPARHVSVGERFVDRLAVLDATTWRIRLLAYVIDPPVGKDFVLNPLYWTRDGRFVYWMDLAGGHVVEIASGRVAALPEALRGCSNLQWQPLPG